MKKIKIIGFITMLILIISYALEMILITKVMDSEGLLILFTSIEAFCIIIIYFANILVEIKEKNYKRLIASIISLIVMIVALIGQSGMLFEQHKLILEKNSLNPTSTNAERISEISNQISNNSLKLDAFILLFCIGVLFENLGFKFEKKDKVEVEDKQNE